MQPNASAEVPRGVQRRAGPAWSKTPTHHTTPRAAPGVPNCRHLQKSFELEAGERPQPDSLRQENAGKKEEKKTKQSTTP